MEKIASATDAISKSADAIYTSQKLLNDNFLLHQERSEKAHELLAQSTNGVKTEVVGIREDFKATMYPIFKLAIAAIIVIAGGTEALKILGVI